MLIPVDALIAGGFYTFAALAVLGAIGLILARSIFHSALFLVATLASVAAVLVILGADFLAVVLVLVYVGAIMVLVLFGIMLTPQRVDLPNVGGPGQAASGALMAGVIFLVAAGIVATTPWPRTVALPVDTRIEASTTQIIGQGLFNVFVLPFEIASVLLVIAMIGAIVIARED